ncbi:MAG: TlpA family protein disulfide reductase [Lacibacter sp.]
MKFIFNLALYLALSATVVAQVPFETSKDPSNGQKTLKGIISREVLQQEPEFSWMQKDISWYKPNAECLALLPQLQDSIYFIVFAGTWCEDSHNVIPQLFKLLDQAKIPMSHVSIVGVDRQKKTLGNLSEALGIAHAPTILVMKKGKEVGRIVEYGKYGIYDKELAEILQAAKK